MNQQQLPLDFYPPEKNRDGCPVVSSPNPPSCVELPTVEERIKTISSILEEYPYFITPLLHLLETWKQQGS